MLAPLEDRSVLERGADEVDVLRRELDTLRREREFERRIELQRSAAFHGELDRLRARGEEQARQIAAYASGEAVIALGRQLMELSAANDGLREAAARARTLQAELVAAHDEFLLLPVERDTLATALAAARASSQ